MRIRQKELKARRHRLEQRLKAGNKGPAVTGTGVPRPAPASRPAPARTGAGGRVPAGGTNRPSRPARAASEA